jgi:glycosyltransferase involved in cell wall biosynthesis
MIWENPFEGTNNFSWEMPAQAQPEEEKVDKKITVLVPCYNEVENVRPLSEAIINIFETDDTLKKYYFDILFIDNCSTDGTRDELEDMCAKDKRITSIFNAKNFGQFNSPFHAMLQAKCDCLISMCCDFQDPVEMLPVFVKEWEQGHKIVCAIKSQSKENKILYTLRSAYYKMIKKFSTVEQIEHFTGFGLYDRDFLEVLRKLDDPTPFLRGIVAELGFKRKEVPYCQQERRAGKTHNNWASLFDAAMLSFTSYTKIGVRMAVVLGSILTAVNLFLGLLYIIFACIFPSLWSVWVLPILISVFLVGSVLMFFIGFVGEYVVSVSQRVTGRPLVVEEKRLNMD